MRARFLLPIFAPLLASLPGLAAAQSPRVYLSPSQVVGEENRLAEGLDSALLAAVEGNPITILTPALSSQSGDLGAAAAKLKEGQKLISSDADKAIDIIKGVVDSYEASMAQVEDFEPYLQALALLANAYLNGGYEDEYTSVAKRLAVLRLDSVPKDASSDVADEVTKVQGKLKKGPQGTIKISTSEAEAIIKIDGLEAASKSVQLPPGVHFVVVSAPGKSPFVEKVSLAAGSTSQVNATLAPLNSEDNSAPSSLEKASAPSKDLLDSLKKGTLDANTRKLAVELAKKNKADIVILNIVARDSGQYRAYSYALRATDASVVELAKPSYTPGPASTLSKPAAEIIKAIVKVAYEFPKTTIPAAPGITIVPKGAVPLAVNVPNPEEDPENNPKVNNGSPTKVNPYAVNIAALPTDAGKDGVLTAPPDARDPNEPVFTGSGNKSNNVPNNNVSPNEPKGRGNNKAVVYEPPKEPKEPREPREPRDPMTWDDLSGKWWFWATVGVVGAGALGSGVYVIATPNGLDTTVTWP